MKHFSSAIRLLGIFSVGCGFIFPLCIWSIAQVVFPFQANGSFLTNEAGKQLRSLLIGQNFSSPRYFHSRPSLAGSGYDARTSGGSNLGPLSEKLRLGTFDNPDSTGVDESFTGFEGHASKYRAENGIPLDTLLPADAITYSGSGLDPDISPANAYLQVARISGARNRSVAEINSLVKKYTQGRTFGLFGEPHVNVLALNLALDEQAN